ncbi:hypothetical protein [Streptomyces pratensis]|uniref:hypothetical protein n=1 Tax=Streptomyces pratensis TaxID=1169025 RepID=UPI0030165C07
MKIMEEMGALLVAAFGLASLSGVMHLVKNSAANGTLERNSALGLKTKVTLSSDTAWASGHKAAVPWLAVCTWTGYFMGAMTAAGAVIAMAAGSVHSALWIFPITGFIAVVALSIRATAVANKHGREAVNSESQKE